MLKNRMKSNIGLSAKLLHDWGSRCPFPFLLSLLHTCIKCGLLALHVECDNAKRQTEKDRRRENDSKAYKEEQVKKWQAVLTSWCT